MLTMSIPDVEILAVRFLAVCFSVYIRQMYRGLKAVKSCA